MPKLARLQPRITTLSTSRARVEGSSKPENRDSLYGRRWRKVRALHLQANPYCVYCKRAGKVTLATVVDHIEPHKGDPGLFWDTNNHQSLCGPHHDATKQREEKRGEVIGCDADGIPLDPLHSWRTVA